MTFPNLKISQLRALVAVAYHKNFSNAALDLNVSQSGISHAIASLEEELGVQLLNRGRYGAHLTPVGEQICQHAEKRVFFTVEKWNYQIFLFENFYCGYWEDGSDFV